MARPMVKITAGEILKILKPVLKKMDKDIADYKKAKDAYPRLLAAWDKKAHRFIMSKGASTLKVTVDSENRWGDEKGPRSAYATRKVSLRAVEIAIGLRPKEPNDPRWDKEHYQRYGKVIPAKRTTLADAIAVYEMADPKEKVSVPINAEWSHFLQY